MYCILPFSRCLSSQFGSGAFRIISCRLNTDNHGMNVVYEGEFTNRLRRVKYLSLSTSVIAMCIQPVILSKLWEDSHSILAVLSVASFTNFFVIGTPLLLQFLARRYVTRLYFDFRNKTFEAVTLTILNRERRLNFKAQDVSVPEIPGPLASFHVKNRPIMLDETKFSDLNIYKHLMGYDKPIDLRLKDT